MRTPAVSIIRAHSGWQRRDYLRGDSARLVTRSHRHWIPVSDLEVILVCWPPVAHGRAPR
jgi:hypothetical protein